MCGRARAPAGRISLLARWASRPRCGWTTPASRWRSTTASCCAATACTACSRPRSSPTSCASASRPTIPRARWWRPRCDAGSTDNCTALVLDVVGLAAGRLGRHRRRIAQLPLIPVPHWRRDDRWLCAQGALVRRPLYPPVRRGGRGRRRRGGAEVSQTAGRQRGSLPRGLRPRGLGRRAREQPLARPRHRAAAGAAELPLHGDAALSGRASGDPARAPPGAGSGGRTQHRDQAGARGGGAASRRHHPSRHQAGQRHPRA